MKRRAIGRFADDLEAVLQPGLRNHFARIFELLHEQSGEAAASPRRVAEIAAALERALADYR